MAFDTFPEAPFSVYGDITVLRAYMPQMPEGFLNALNIVAADN